MFFKKNNDENKLDDFAKVAALLIHAAKIDEIYSNKEEQLIKKTLIEIGADNQSLEIILKKGKIIEEDAVQILDFTKEVKNMDEKNKIKVVEALWQIIYSNKDVDIYEANLMRRLAGLLYIDSKIMGDIKERIRKKNL